MHRWLFTLCTTKVKDIYFYVAQKKKKRLMSVVDCVYSSNSYSLDQLEQTLQGGEGVVLLSLIGICSICYFFNLHLCPLFLPVFTSHSLSCSGFEHLRGKELLLNHCGNQPVCDDSKQLSHLPLPFPNQPEEGVHGQVDCYQLGAAHLPLPLVP